MFPISLNSMRGECRKWRTLVWHSFASGWGMAKGSIFFASFSGCAALGLQAAVSLPAVTVYSPRVANQSSVATFAMPISALRYEPRVDIQGRNFAEGQADITIRGGTFENTGLMVGGASLSDPQTGHYHAELPIAPAMLGVPRLVTGANLSLGAANMTSGGIAYSWRPIGDAGIATLATGENRLRRGEFYSGQLLPRTLRGRRLGFDLALAHSRSDGAVPHGDHEVGRVCFRGQLAKGGGQTDLFLGYQGKRFGWPNLYTPFGSNEFENIKTRLSLLNHRVELAGGDHLEASVFERRNKDDYSFDRNAPVGPLHPFQHTTWLKGLALQSRHTLVGTVLDVRAEVAADRLQSTSLLFGRYSSRKTTKLAFLGGRTWDAASGEFGFRAGVAHDDTNRDGGAFSPVGEFSRSLSGHWFKRVQLSFGRSTQMPSYTALNSSPVSGLFRGNPDLGRSASDNLECGLAADLGRWAIEMAVFFRRDRRLVDWTFRRGTTARTANAMDVEVSGAEVVARSRWEMGEITLGYTALDKTYDYRGASVDASFYALNYARHRFTAALAVRLGRGVELRIDNSVRVQAENILRVQGGNRAIHTLLGAAWRPSRLPTVELSLTIENVWNDDFQEIPAVPAAPRQAALAVGTTW